MIKTSILDVTTALDLRLLLERNENMTPNNTSMMSREPINKFQPQANLNQINTKLNECKKREKWML